MSRKVRSNAAGMLETLEGRTMFAALPSDFISPTPEFVNGIVHVQGTKYDDRITISLNSDGIGIDVNVNGEVSAFFRSMVSGFLINGGKGKDVVQVIETVGAVEVPITFIGGNGKDILVSGGGHDTFIGGAGKDKLVNGTEDDTFYQKKAPLPEVV